MSPSEAVTLPLACTKCGGLLHPDEGYGEYRTAPALACYQCGARVELDAQGTPLVIAQMPRRLGTSVEERILVLAAQHVTAGKIAQRLKVSVALVRTVVGAATHGLLRPAGQESAPAATPDL